MHRKQWIQWLETFLAEHREIAPVLASGTDLNFGTTDLRDCPEFLAEWLSFLAERSDSFPTFEEYLLRFSLTISKPRVPVIQEPSPKRVHREALPAFAEKLAEYHLRQNRFVRDLERYEADRKQHDEFVSRYSKDAEGYRAYVDGILQGELNRFLEHPVFIPIAENRRYRHTYICGGTGSGKSVMQEAIIHHYIEKRDCAVVVLDPHGELVEGIAKFPMFADRNQLAYIDPSLSSEHTPTLNPFDVPHDASPRDLDVQRQQLLAAFGAVLGDGSGFTDQMKAILSPCITTLLRKPGASISDLKRFMDDEGNADLVETAQSVLTNPEDVHFMERHFGTTAYDATKKGILTRLHNLLTSEVFRNFLVGKSTFQLESLLEQKKTILFNLKDASASGQDSAFNAIGRFIIARLIGIVFRRSPAPIHFFLDEAHNYSTPAISKILTEARKFGLYLTLSNQSVSQFDNPGPR